MGRLFKGKSLLSYQIIDHVRNDFRICLQRAFISEHFNSENRFLKDNKVTVVFEKSVNESQPPAKPEA